VRNKKNYILFIQISFLLFNSLIADEVGPYLGTIKTTEIYLLYSPDKKEQTLTLKILNKSGSLQAEVKAEALAKNDFVAKFHIRQLAAGQKYYYKIDGQDEKGNIKELIAGEEFNFKTLSLSRKAKFTVAFVACVNKHTTPVWSEIDELEVDALCLAGDTPYIDSKDLKTIRRKHRAFLQTKELAAIAKDTSILGNWDDHDFGLNNGNGKNFAAHKSKTRQVFLEYRAHDQYGDGKGGGVYHKTDHGAIEIFHLDPRWYSQTASSPVDPSQTTCFGKEQWDWLLKSLKESKAPFKVLSMGGIWQDKRSWETDDMFTYWYERDALFDFIKKEKISGVVLHGGDIHVSRYLMHPMRLGYNLHDFIMSPGHKHTIKSLDIYHPSYEWSLLDGQQFLTMTADTTKKVPSLTVQYRQKNGKIAHEVNISYDELSPKQAEGLQQDLRAAWTFDKDLSNSSILGKRIDGKAMNGASIVVDGVKGQALSLNKSQKQYFNIPRSFLDDNSKKHTISFWAKAKTLPKHATGERAFLMESTAQGKASDKSAYHFSLGLRSTEQKDKVNLQLYTHTVKPAVASLKAPTEIFQGPFDLAIDREVLENKWVNFTLTYDSKKIDIYLNGELLKSHKLKIAGPAAEFGGLILGGHRAGEGRNFDGLMDEVLVWQRLLSKAEIKEVYNTVNQ